MASVTCCSATSWKAIERGGGILPDVLNMPVFGLRAALCEAAGKPELSPILSGIAAYCDPDL
jgi:hypothetical protein